MEWWRGALAEADQAGADEPAPDWRAMFSEHELTALAWLDRIEAGRLKERPAAGSRYPPVPARPVVTL